MILKIYFKSKVRIKQKKSFRDLSSYDFIKIKNEIFIPNFHKKNAS
jgi:hypothetical protein